jgi:tetratricopeptide (TPR) repeat protein
MAGGKMLEMVSRHFTAGRLDEADLLCRQVLDGTPQHPDALHLLGAIAYRRQQYTAAIELISAAIGRNPAAANYYNTRALAFRDFGNTGPAIEDFERAVAIKPDYAEAFVNLGYTFEILEQRQRAWECYRHALSLSAGCAAAHHQIARLLRKEGHLTRALLHCRRCIALEPDWAEAHSTLGAILRDSGEFEAAVASCQKALAIAPRYHGAYVNLAVSLKGMGRISDAIGALDRALEIEPQNAATRFNRALMLLASGDLASGWAEYEWGLVSGNRKPQRPFTQPRWSGQPLAGKTILVWGEQGVGDEMFFASVVPEVAQAASACILECEPRLVSLFARSFPNVRVVPRTAPPHPETLRADIDFQIAAGSLPALLRTSLASFPQRGYMVPDAGRMAFWRNRLQKLGAGITVGVCWRSKLRTDVRDRHYTTLEELRPVLHVAGARFVNLQYDECEAELQTARQESGVPIANFSGIDLMNGLDEVAALISALDLVISVDTAVAAMAGALGKPLWQLTLFDSDCGTLGTDYIPWWPQARVFRREPDHRNWDPVIRQVANELAALARQKSESFAEPAALS